MNSVSYLQKEHEEHEEIFRGLLEFEEMIDENNLNYWELVYVFHKITNLLLQHKQNEEILLDEVNNSNHMKIPVSEIMMDQRRIRGHIKVINEAISSKKPDFIKVSLDNDGRMLISTVKEHVFREERTLGRILFLKIIQR